MRALRLLLPPLLLLCQHTCSTCPESVVHCSHCSAAAVAAGKCRTPLLQPFCCCCCLTLAVATAAAGHDSCFVALMFIFPCPAAWPLLRRDMVAQVQQEHGKLDILVNK